MVKLCKRDNSVSWEVRFMKKSGLLAAAMMAAVVIGGCQTAEEKPVYNFSTRFPNASEAYGVQYGDTLYFISLFYIFLMLVF